MEFRGAVDWTLLRLPALPMPGHDAVKDEGTERVPIGWSYNENEAEEKRKLIYILKSPVCQHHNTTHFHQLLCQDPSCEVCNIIAAEVDEFMDPETLIDGFTSVAPTATITESSFNLRPGQSVAPPKEVTSEPSPLPRPSSPHPILKHNQRIHFADCVSPALPRAPSLEPCAALDPQLHQDNCPLHHLSFSPCETEAVGPIVLQVEPLSYQHPRNTLTTTDSSPLQDINTLSNFHENSFPCHQSELDISDPITKDFAFTMTDPKSITIFLKSGQQNLPVHSPAGLSKSALTITGSDHPPLEISNLAGSQTQHKTTTSSTWAPSTCDQEYLPPDSPKTSFGENFIICLVETGNHSFVSSKVLILLESHIQKRIKLLTLKGRENNGNSFLKPLSGANQIGASGKMSTSKLTFSHPSWPNTDVPKEFQEHDLALNNSLKDTSQKKYTQFFWGLPFLHSESLCSTAHVLDDHTSDCIFNKTLNESTVQKVISLTLPLSEIQHRQLPEVLTPPKSVLLTETQSLPQVVPTLPSALPVEPLPQSHYRTQKESLPLADADIQRLEWQVLQKQQSVVWGLPAVVQRSQKEFYPPAPNAPGHRASRVCTSISILQGDFPLSTDLTKKLEHHLRKRLIQHRWGLPRRIFECLSVRKPPDKFSEMGESSRNLDSIASQSESIHRSSVDMNMGKENRQNTKKRPKYHLSDQGNSSEMDLELQSDQNIKGMSGNDTSMVEKNESPQNLELVLKNHLSKKFEEIHEGRLPGTVKNSWHTSKMTLSASQKSLSPVKQRKLTLAVGEEVCLNTGQVMPFFDSRARQIMEAHIKRFQKQMIWGLPKRVCESIESCKLMTIPSRSNRPSLTKWHPKGGAQCGSFNPPRHGAEFLQDDQSEIKYLSSSVDPHVPDASPLQQKRTLKQAPVALRNALNEEIKTLKTGKNHLMPVKNSPEGKENLRESLPANSYPSNLPARQGKASHEPMLQNVRFSNEAGIPCDLSKPATPREIPRVEQQIAVPSEAQNHVTSNRVGTFPKVSAQEEAECNVVAGVAPMQQFFQHFTSSYLKFKLIDELKITLKHREQVQSKDKLQVRSQSSDNLTYKISVNQSLGFHGNLGVSPALHIQLEDHKVSLEGKQEPQLPNCVLRQCRDEALSKAPVSSCPGTKSPELGAGDAHLDTAGCGRKVCPSQIKALQEIQGSKSQSLLQRGQSPENYYRKKVKDCFQRLSLRNKIKRQESSQEMHRPISSVSNRGLVKIKAVPLGKNENPKMTTHPQKSLGEKLGHVPPPDGTCPQIPSPSPLKLKTAHQAAEAQVQRKAVQEGCLKNEVPSIHSRAANAKSYQAEAVSAHQRCPRHNRCILDKAPLQRAVAFKGQRVCLKHGPAIPCRQPVAQPGMSCK